MNVFEDNRFCIKMATTLETKLPPEKLKFGYDSNSILNTKTFFAPPGRIRKYLM